jgi:hypothetical protein
MGPDIWVQRLWGDAGVKALNIEWIPMCIAKRTSPGCDLRL